jgi:transposase
VISPIAFEAVQKIDAIFMLERSINGLTPRERLTARRSDIAPLVNDFINWMRRERAKLSRHNEVAKAMDYMLRRVVAFTRFLEDGRICMSNNAAERVLRGVALGRNYVKRRIMHSFQSQLLDISKLSTIFIERREYSFT